MKVIMVFLFTCVGLYPICAQNADESTGGYTFGLQYSQEFVLHGYVRVREWDVIGDKMSLKDLDMNTYSALQFNVTRNFRKKNRSLNLSIDRYFMIGTTAFDRDINYNGTIIDGRNGVDVSPTRYYRMSIMYSDILMNRENFFLNYLGGLVVDHIVFYVDGAVRSYSPKNEVYEDFGRQAFPYPVVGIRSQHMIGQGISIRLDAFGTYIPKFKSFYAEGGNIYLQYSTVLADIKYVYNISEFDLAAGGRFRHMKLSQESHEDTNELHTVTAGPYVELVYHF